MSKIKQNTVQREKRKREESRGNMCVCVGGGGPASIATKKLGLQDDT